MGGPGGILPNTEAINAAGNFIASFTGMKALFTVVTALLEPISGKPAATFDFQPAGGILFTPVSSGEVDESARSIMMPVKGGGSMGTVGKTIDRAATSRGVANEAKVLKDMGVPKNTTPKTVRDPKTGNPVTVIPDGIDAKNVIEVKDTKSLSNTKQIRGERVAAELDKKEFKIVTGENTKVAGTIKEDEIIRRRDIGPQ
jgi:hypothetical protein